MLELKDFGKAISAIDVKWEIDWHPIVFLDRSFSRA